MPKIAGFYMLKSDTSVYWYASLVVTTSFLRVYDFVLVEQT
jgi:hypothetical protein